MRLELPPRLMKLFCNRRFESERTIHVLEGIKTITKSELYKHLHAFKTEQILYMMAITTVKTVKKNLSFYYTHLRSIKTTVNGKDLLNLGLRQGPAFRETLDAVLSAKLNGRVKTRRDELAYVGEYITKMRKRGVTGY
jgi:tRNA nucleotidyltransferase (CCA-adding enzyme)